MQTEWILALSATAAWVITWLTVINFAKKRAARDARVDERLVRVEDGLEQRRERTSQLFDLVRDIQRDVEFIKGKIAE